MIKPLNIYDYYIKIEPTKYSEIRQYFEKIKEKEIKKYEKKQDNSLVSIMKVGLFENASL